MSEIILDGTGSGFTSKVNKNNRFYVDAVQRARTEEASIEGDSYNINTGVINLTSANKSAVLYIKNNEETKRLVITSLFYLIGNSTGGSGDVLITVLRNPTAGTIVSNATTVEMNANRNFSSSRTLVADVYKGAEGSTHTDGDKAIESIFNQAPTRAVLSVGHIILGRGSSLGIDITPATGNTSLDVEFALACHLEDPEV